MYILLIMIFTANGQVSATTAEMTSQASCQTAKVAIEQAPTAMTSYRTAVCVPK